jgi:hypothetical protein
MVFLIIGSIFPVRFFSCGLEYLSMSYSCQQLSREGTLNGERLTVPC